MTRHCGLDPQSIVARPGGCRIKSGMTAYFRIADFGRQPLHTSSFVSR
jgi:hypothetical protein